MSVVVPIYNVEAYLEECLDSIRDQSIDSLEVVLVDDGSTDGSTDIALRYAEQYPNFVYYLKENGGLGDARNYGMDRAKGEYICFSDSDDTIPPLAYEHMYDLAKKYDLDIVSGDIQRFTSGRTYPSGLHRIAFRDTCDQMNIHDHPELLYDSTTPTKLFRTSFLKDCGLRFPRDMYYEDIPFNLPIQCLAKKIGHVDEVVYNWRSREGGESITQNRLQWKNFSDRLKAVKMVDAFFAEHVTDDALLLEKDVKTLRIDLRLYLDELPKASEEFRQSFMSEVVPYVRSLRKDAFERLDAVDRIKYHYVLEDDLTGLLTYLQYSRQARRALPVKEHNGKYYGGFAQKIDPSWKEMTYELEHKGCAVSITGVSLKEGEDLCVSGKVFFRDLSSGTFDDLALRAFVQSQVDGHDVFEAKASIERKALFAVDHRHSVRHRFVRNLSRTRSLYNIEIPWESIETLANGIYKLRFDYSRNGLEASRVFAAYPSSGPESHAHFVIKDDRKYSISYTPARQLQIEISAAPRDIVTDTSFESGKLVLFDNGRVVDKFQVESDDIRTMRDFANTVNHKCYETVMGMPSFYAFGKATLEVIPTPAGHLNLRALQFGAVSHSSSFEGGVFTFNIYELFKGQLDGYDRVELVGRKIGVKIACDNVVRSSNGNIICKFNVRNDGTTKDMPADVYELVLRHHSQNDVAFPPLRVYCSDRYNVETLVLRGQGYKYSLTTKGIEGIVASKAWGVFENTKHKRKVLKDHVYYRIYRVARSVLPLRKKTVLFEAYWGTQVSCNPDAMYRYLEQHHPEYRCVWSLVDERMPVEGNALRVRKGSLSYYLTLARAHYMINNANFETWHEKRRGQIEVQTTHGTPLKKLGFDVKDELNTPERLEAFTRRCARWDYLVSPGPRTTKILTRCYRFKKQFLETGFPRNDELFERNVPEEIARIKESIGIPVDKKVVLYAPTWRIRNKFNLALDLAALQDSLGEEYVVGLRPHYFSLSGVKWNEIDSRILDMSKGLSIEDCYLIADVLITDYSSVMFDYAVLGKPMIFFVYDLESYRDDLRGFNFDFEKEAPGPLCKTSDEVIDALVNLEQTKREYEQAYEAFREGFGGYEHGNAAERIFEEVFQ